MTISNEALAMLAAACIALVAPLLVAITLVQSVFEKAVPLVGGGYNPSMSFYANYILFDSPAPLGAAGGDHQVFMRYLGPL